jgi:hypothetical protein
MKLNTPKTVTMLGDLISPQPEFLITPNGDAVQVSTNYGGVIETFYPAQASPFQGRPLPTLVVELINATHHRPLWQFGLN